LQGTTPVVNSNWCFGLFVGKEIVGVMAFAKHEKKFLNLTRMAFPLGITVVGGPQKLFRNALVCLPSDLDIVTFSNNQYSNGAVYTQLGFVKEKDLPPSYQWYFKGCIWNKRRLRCPALIKILGETFNPLETAHQNLYRNGARCLYDAGYQKWVYRRQKQDFPIYLIDEPPIPENRP
jgi:hypothetical protein